MDGKERKAYKLKPISEEIQLVKTIFSVFMETGSLSKTDQYLLEHRCVTKRGKQFTRFAIKGILTNPVYMVADETAYRYLKENNTDLFVEQSRLSELEALTEQSWMLHQEFAFYQGMIESFAHAVDTATLEEKRRLLRTVVKKVAWDGKNAYVYLFFRPVGTFLRSFHRETT